MDAVLFAAKRAHYAGLQLTRPILGKVGLTPARFDILFWLAEQSWVATQTHVRKALGVARATMSEMLKELQALGWISRTRCLEDRRTWDVALTETGRALVERAFATSIGDGSVTLAVDQALSNGDAERDPGSRRYELASIAQALCSWFGKGNMSTLYPWDPEEFVDWFAEVGLESHDVPFVDAAFEKQ